MTEANLVAKWNGKEYKLDFQVDQSIKQLKEYLYEITQVSPSKQKLIGLVKGKLPPDETLIKDLKLKATHHFIMMGTVDEDIIKDQSDLDVVNDLDIDYRTTTSPIKDPANQLALHKTISQANIHLINPPKQGKKLLVLDLDYTLFDCKSTANHIMQLARPGLHEMLTVLAPYYEYCIWSQTSWRWLEAKITELGMLTHPEYQISFVLDITFMFSITGKKKRHQGLKITPFKNALSNTGDKELWKLCKYLLQLTLVDDFKTMDHRNWKEFDGPAPQISYCLYDKLCGGDKGSPKMLDIEIFHEKQEGQLCAQHAINNLLQGSYFTAVDLSSIAQQLDQEELQTLEAQTNFQSSNYDDSGFFSVQVVARALQVFGLELLPYGSSDPIAKYANTNPESQSAYICNLDQHWFAIRKFGNVNTRFYNLNSTFPEPKHITETYLGMFLLQIKTEGYSIFIVNGELPTSDADQQAMLNPIPQKIQQYDSESDLEKAIKMSMGQTEEEDDLQRAIKESMMDVGNDEESLALAMSASLKDQGNYSSNPQSSSANTSVKTQVPIERLPELPMDEMRRKRLERFGQ
ncbi:hypothetical protein HDV04_001033 [Boothiomyces sp. JEL0838]|nr:hypothetical protein HDV04_001033 [Boothiomyces sp. JEL0838]